MNKSSLISILIIQAGIFCTHGAEIDVPKDYKSIGQALEQAKEGDLVVVSPGTYFERIKIPDGVTVRSSGNDEKGKVGLKRAELVILDGKGEASEDAGIELGEGSVVDGMSVMGMGKYDEDSWNTFISDLNIKNAEKLSTQDEVKNTLRLNTEDAINAGVFGVPTIIANGHLFWGVDATDMYLEYWKNPNFFDEEQMKKIDKLPQAARR